MLRIAVNILRKRLRKGKILYEGWKLRIVVNILRKRLRKDKILYEGWKLNIAMAFLDEIDQYKARHNKITLNKHDRKIVANNAADYFLKQLTK